MSARARAHAVLCEVILRGRSLSDTLAAGVADLGVPRERAFARELCFGVVRWLPRLEAIAGELLAHPLRPRDGDVRVALLLGLHQLLHTRVPAHAAVSETVSAAAALGKPWARGVLNATLRRFEREREAVLARVDADPQAALAHPRWLLDALAAAWPGDWRRIVDAANRRPPMVLRVNRARVERDAYLARLAAAGLGACAAPHVRGGVILEQPVDVAALPGFEAGLVSVQDGAAQLAAGLVAPTPGSRVLDACAAPGGKTAHLLEEAARAGDGAPELVAVDRDAARTARLEQALARLGLGARTVCADVTDTAAWWDGARFDRILLDVPCSATGVVRRHPDIKLHRRATDLPALAATQQRMLAALWPLLAPGGRLVYATCSVLPEENQLPVQRFLAEREDAEALPIDAPPVVARSVEVQWGRRVAPGRQILPGEDDMDGFYYAVLRKR